jgi:uncharacterized membrane protein YdjX (TVP38/TMEM64 family)
VKDEQTFEWRRIAPLAALLAGLALVLAFGFDRAFSLEAARAHRAAVVAWTEAHPLLAQGVCMLAAAALMAMAFPSIGVAMATAAFIFGLWRGFALTLVGATAGGLILFLAARSARDGLLNTRAGWLLARLEGASKNNGFFYLLSLRLIPIFPTALVTLVAAAARLSVRDFVPATLLGAAPAGLAFASFGAGVGGVVEEGGEIALFDAMLRPQILAPLVLLAVLSLAAAWARTRIKRA